MSFKCQQELKNAFALLAKKNGIVKNAILLKLSLKILMKKNFGGISLGFVFVINKTK